MGSFIQVMINGILLGSMYGIAAIGLSLIFGTMRIIFLAQGTMIVFFAYVVYWCFVKAGIDPYLCLLIVVPLAFVVGLGLFYLLFRKAAALEDKNVSLLLAVGLMYLVENLILKVWSATPRGLNISYSGAIISGWGLRVSWLRARASGARARVRSRRVHVPQEDAVGDRGEGRLRRHGGDDAPGHQLGVGLRHQLRPRHRPGGSGGCRDGLGLLL